MLGSKDHLIPRKGINTFIGSLIWLNLLSNNDGCKCDWPFTFEGNLALVEATSPATS